MMIAVHFIDDKRDIPRDDLVLPSDWAKLNFRVALPLCRWRM